MPPAGTREEIGSFRELCVFIGGRRRLNRCSNYDEAEHDLSCQCVSAVPLRSGGPLTSGRSGHVLASIGSVSPRPNGWRRGVHRQAG